MRFTFPLPAPLQDFWLACPSSNAGIPGLSIPAGLNAADLPVGIEIDGPLGSDKKLISIALAIEKVLGRLAQPAF